jgi:RimJ/RimL family protein N-acetyltransferase
MHPVTLRTERLVLRVPSEDDIDAITAACQDPEIPRWTTVPHPYTRDDAAAFVELCAQWWQEGVETVWAAHHGDLLVGVVGLHRITPHPFGGVAELGYWMAPESRGRGFLVEAARAVIDWSFDDLDLARLQWQAVVGNVPSARSARALGFRFEGTRRQGLSSPRGRDDGWMAGLLRDDDRTPVPWPVLEG